MSLTKQMNRQSGVDAFHLLDLEAAQRRIQKLLGERHLTEAIARRVADETGVKVLRYRAVIDAMETCVVLFNHKGICLFFNPTAATHLNIDETLVGGEVVALADTPLGQSGLADQFDKVTAKGEAVAWQYILPDPRPKTWHAQLKPISESKDDAGSILLTCDPTAEAERDEAPKQAAVEALAALTSREREVLDMVAAGYESAQIAKMIHRSHKTVQLHRYHISTKLGTSNIANWMRLLLDAGLLKPIA